MSVRISEKEPYTLALDSLDMQYIHTNISYVEDDNMTDLKPIWKRNCDERKYYEFEIVSGSNDSDVESLNDIKYYLCHICKANVPVIFIKQHYASDKHKTMQKLSKKVLERVSKSINVCTDVVENTRKDIYYCATCSTIVLKSNKDAHNMSKNHLISLTYDDAMKQCLDLFLNGLPTDLDTNQKNDNDIVVTNSKNDSVITKKGTKDSAVMANSKNDSVVTNLNNDDLKETRLNSSPLIDKSLDRSLEKYDRNTEYVTENNLKTKSGTYAEILMKKDKDDEIYKPIPLSNSESVILYCKGKHKIKIPWNNYHSFLVNGTKFFCMLCYELLIDTTQDHVVSDRHIESVCKPIDKHLMRQSESGLNHCVICNMLTRTHDHFTQNLHQSLINNHEIKPRQETSYKYCKTCDRQIDNNDKLHEQSVEHALSTIKLSDNKQKVVSESVKSGSSSVATKSDDNKITTVANNKSDSQQNVTPDYITAGRNPKEVYCEICKVYLPNTPKNIKEHTGSSKHGSHLTTFVEENRLKVIDDHYQCLLCCTMIKQPFTHVNSLIHKEIFKKYKSATEKNITDSTETISDIARSVSDIPQSVSDISQSVSDTVKNAKTPNDFCDICNVILPHGGRPVHEIGLKHKTNLAKISGADIEVSDNLNLDNDPYSTMMRARSELMTFVNDKQLECKVCKSIISNHNIHIHKHIIGKKHIANYKIFLNEKL